MWRAARQGVRVDPEWEREIMMLMSPLPLPPSEPEAPELEVEGVDQAGDTGDDPTEVSIVWRAHGESSDVCDE